MRKGMEEAEKGIPTSVVNSNGELEKKDRKHKKRKDKDKAGKKSEKRRIDNNGHGDKTNQNVTNGSKTVQLKEQPDKFIQKWRFNGPADGSARENKRVRIQ